MEPVINFPQPVHLQTSETVTPGLVLREYGVVDEHYTRTLNSREEIFNVELGEYIEYLPIPTLFYYNELADTLSQFVEENFYAGNGQYSLVANNPSQQSILYLNDPAMPTVVLSYTGENGKVISFGSAWFFSTEQYCCQFSNNCANYLTGNEIVQVSSGENTISNSDYLLFPNYPNPFNPSTTIEFSIEQHEQNKQIEIGIYNLKGQKVKTLNYRNSFSANTRDSCSTYTVTWNGTDSSDKPVSSGIYFYKLKVGNKTKAVRKCLLLK
jgi:hypothetical protein